MLLTFVKIENVLKTLKDANEIIFSDLKSEENFEIYIFCFLNLFSLSPK